VVGVSEFSCLDVNAAWHSSNFYFLIRRRTSALLRASLNSREEAGWYLINVQVPESGWVRWFRKWSDYCKGIYCFLHTDIHLWKHMHLYIHMHLLEVSVIDMIYIIFVFSIIEIRSTGKLIFLRALYHFLADMFWVLLC